MQYGLCSVFQSNSVCGTMNTSCRKRRMCGGSGGQGRGKIRRRALTKEGDWDYDDCKSVDADCHHHLSGGHDCHRLDLLQAHVQRGRLLSGRTQAGPADHGDERRGLGHVVLAAAGPAGRGLHLGHCGRGLDGHRSGGGHLSELADRGEAHPRLHGPRERHHRAGLLLQALP